MNGPFQILIPPGYGNCWGLCNPNCSLSWGTISLPNIAEAPAQINIDWAAVNISNGQICVPVKLVQLQAKNNL